jgi:hypothetical protein
LLSTEEKLAAVNQKTVHADSKWEARVREYEARFKAAEERVKRERQGSKERVLELENSLKCVFFYKKYAFLCDLNIFFLGVYNDSLRLRRNAIHS